MDKAVLELGAGTGLVSVVAALLGKRLLASSCVLQVEELTVGLGVQVDSLCTFESVSLNHLGHSSVLCVYNSICLNQSSLMSSICVVCSMTG